PFGFSPMKAPKASSGVRGVEVVRFTCVWSLTIRDAANVALAKGTWLTGSAWSSQTVPLKTLSFRLPRSDVSVTLVPDGDVRVMSMSPQKVCVMNVFALRSRRYVGSPETTIVDVTTGVPLEEIAFGTSVLSKWNEVPVQGVGSGQPQVP